MRCMRGRESTEGSGGRGAMGIILSRFSIICCLPIDNLSAMAHTGIPVHAADESIARLVHMGYRVAVCTQEAA